MTNKTVGPDLRLSPTQHSNQFEPDHHAEMPYLKDSSDEWVQPSVTFGYDQFEAWHHTKREAEYGDTSCDKSIPGASKPLGLFDCTILNEDKMRTPLKA